MRGRWRPLIAVLHAVSQEAAGLSVIAVPEDWHAALGRTPQFEEVRIALGLDERVTHRVLPLPGSAQVERIVQAFFSDRGVQVERDLVEFLGQQVDSLRQGDGSFMSLLSQVLTTLYRTWRHRSSADSSHRSVLLGAHAAAAGAVIGVVEPLPKQGDRRVPLTKTEFEAEARMDTAINDLCEQAYEQFLKQHPSERLTPGVLKALIRRFVWISATDQRRSLQPIVARELGDPQTALLEALVTKRLTQRAGGQWRLAHESVLDHWDRASQVYRQQVSDAVLVSALRERATTWNAWGKPPRFLVDQSETYGGANFLDIERVFGEWCDELERPLREFLEASLLANTTNPPTHDAAGHSRLYWIAGSNSPGLLEHYLQLFPELVRFATASGGDLPLHAASLRGRDPNVELLLAAGSDVDAPNLVGGTPLLAAALPGRVSTCRILLRAGADVCRRTPEASPQFSRRKSETASAQAR